MKIDLVILAAGFSSRFHENKLLYPYQGKALIHYPLQAAQFAGFSCVHVVTQYPEVKSIVESYGYSCVWNKHPEKGIAHSLKLGLEACEAADAIVFLTADMPWIQRKTLKLMASMADSSHIICAWSEGSIQNPMLFPSCYFKELKELQGDYGGKQIALRHFDSCVNFVLDKRELKDIDTLQDLED